MPLTKRGISPENVSLNRIPPSVKQNELECVANGSLGNLVRQLSSLSRHAEDIMGELYHEAVKIEHKTNTLLSRVDRLAFKVTQLDSNVEEVSLQDLHLRKPFKSSSLIDQQSLSRQTLPTAMSEAYSAIDQPPDLNKLNPYRDDDLPALKLYTDPEYFFRLWREEMLKDGENAKKTRHQPNKQDGGGGGRRHGKGGRKSTPERNHRDRGREYVDKVLVDYQAPEMVMRPATASSGANHHQFNNGVPGMVNYGGGANHHQHHMDELGQQNGGSGLYEADMPPYNNHHHPHVNIQQQQQQQQQQQYPPMQQQQLAQHPNMHHPSSSGVVHSYAQQPVPVSQYHAPQSIMNPQHNIPGGMDGNGSPSRPSQPPPAPPTPSSFVSFDMVPRDDDFTGNGMTPSSNDDPPRAPSPDLPPPPPPLTFESAAKPAPPQPPPPSSQSASTTAPPPPPPPPPPPIMSGGGPFTPSAINKGGSASPPSSSAKNGVGAAARGSGKAASSSAGAPDNSDLLRAIREGITLKKVERQEEKQKEKEAVDKGTDVAAILRKRMEDVMGTSDTDDSHSHGHSDNDWDE